MLITRVSSTHVQFLVQRLFPIQFPLFLASLEDQRACIRAINLAATHFRGDWPVPPKCSRNTPIHFFYIFGICILFNVLLYFLHFFCMVGQCLQKAPEIPRCNCCFLYSVFLCYASLYFCIFCNVFLHSFCVAVYCLQNTPEIPWRYFSLAMP